MSVITVSEISVASRLEQRRSTKYHRFGILPTFGRAGLLAITLIAWHATDPAAAQSLATYVSGQGTDNGPCSSSKPCKTFQAALAKTASGGQVTALDSADYGYLTVNQAVTIVGNLGGAGVLTPSSLSGITINAGSSDVVTLQGLELDGAGSATNGIQFVSGGALNIRDSVIRSFSNGVNFQPAGTATLATTNTLITNNTTGVLFQSPASGPNLLDNVQLVGNGTGLSVAGTNSTTPATVTIQNSVVANNPSVGITAGSNSVVTVANSTIANNGIGLQVQSNGALMQVSGSTIFGNSTGWVAASGGQLTSSGNNVSGGNSTANALPAPPPPVASAPPPPVASTSPPPPTGTTGGTDYVLDNAGNYLVDSTGAKITG